MKNRLAEKVKKILCASLRHSNVVTIHFGFALCSRCGEQLWDTLVTEYCPPLMVSTQCDCRLCRENWKKSTWVDRLMADKPKWLDYRDVDSYNAVKSREMDEYIRQDNSPRRG